MERLEWRMQWVRRGMVFHGESGWFVDLGRASLFEGFGGATQDPTTSSLAYCLFLFWLAHVLCWQVHDSGDVCTSNLAAEEEAEHRWFEFGRPVLSVNALLHALFCWADVSLWTASSSRPVHGRGRPWRQDNESASFLVVPHWSGDCGSWSALQPLKRWRARGAQCSARAREQGQGLPLATIQGPEECKQARELARCGQMREQKPQDLELGMKLLC